MFEIKVKKNLNVQGLEERINSAKQKALFSTAVQFARLSEPYVRYQTGQLARSVQFSDFKNGHITYDTPYARYAYYNERSKVTTDKHPLACAKWSEVAWEAKKDQLTEHFNKTLGDNLK